jgi:hypothetical protein
MSTVAALLAVWCGAAFGQQQFPAIQGETLAGKKVELPGAFGGQAAVIVGFTHASQKQTKEWAMRLRGQEVVWSIAVLEDAPKLVRGMIVHGIKGAMPKEAWDRFAVVVKGEKELKDAAGFEKPDDAYVMVVDAVGAIRWRFHGPPTDAAVQDLRNRQVPHGQDRD